VVSLLRWDYEYRLIIPRFVLLFFSMTIFAGLSKLKPGFDSRPVFMGFMVDEMALGQDFLQVLRSFPVSIIP
jgi:hypothetical protein